MEPTGPRIVGLEQRKKPREQAHLKYFQAKLDCIGIADRERLMLGMPDLVRYCYLYDDDTYQAGFEAHLEYFGKVFLGGCELAGSRVLWGRPEFNGAVSVWREPSAGRLFEVQHHTAASYQAMLDGYPLYRELRDAGTPPADRLRLHARLRAIAAAVPAPTIEPHKEAARTAIPAIPERPDSEQTTYYKLLLLGHDPSAPVGVLRRRVWPDGMADETLRPDRTWWHSPALVAYCRGDLHLIPKPIPDHEARILADLLSVIQGPDGPRGVLRQH